MNSVTIGSILKNLRQKANLSLQDVTTILCSRYSIELSPRTLLSHEAGCGKPDITHFLALCKIYDCNDILYAFGYSDEKYALTSLSSEERQIINRYRTLPTLEKNIIHGALGIKKGSLLQKTSLSSRRAILLL